MTARVIFHLSEEYFDRYHTAKHLALFPAIEQIILRRGGSIGLAKRPGKDLDAAARKGDGDLHIVEGGQVRAKGYLNAALAYLPGFWHLDPHGVLADSAIGKMRFDPVWVPEAASQVFYDGLRQDFALPRRSRYAQSETQTTLPDGAIVVFLQGPLPQRRKQAYLHYADLLRCVAKAADGRPVLAKAHPLQPEFGQAIICKVQAEGHAIIETAANVHDLLAAACVSVSVNSAAAVEGFLHDTPAILFGRSDYAQMVETVKRAKDFPAALSRALASQHDYARWMYWYFAQNCLWLDGPDFETDLLASFAAAGFDAARLGLH